MTRFIVVSCFYNCEKFVVKWAESLANQTHNNFHILAIDDASYDNTGYWLDVFSKERIDITVIHNNKRQYYMYNLTYSLLNSGLNLNDEDVIILVDGDDWLFGDFVFEKMSDIYNNPDIWMTYGQYVRSNGIIGCGGAYAHDARPRYQKAFMMSPLRTYKWFLFKNVDRRYLYDGDKCMKAAADKSLMITMAEMAGWEHIQFVKEILYVYNQKNPESHFKKGYEEAYKKLDELILGFPPSVIKSKEELINGKCNW